MGMLHAPVLHHRVTCSHGHPPPSLAELWERLQGYFKVRAYPGWFVHWPQIEVQAKALRWFELVAVPGLLQTEDYARAMLSTQVMAASRLARQAVLAREHPPMLWVLLDEGVLWRPAGDAGVMAAQVGRLLAAARLPNAVIQVIPWSAGAHQGMSGNFVIADLPDGTQVVYQDTAARGQIVEDSDDIRSVVLVWDTLKSEALPRTASLALMEEAARSWTRAASSGASRATAPATAEPALRLAPPPA